MKKYISAGKYRSSDKRDLFPALRNDLGWGGLESDVYEDVDEVLFGTMDEYKRIIQKKDKIIDILENGTDSSSEELVDALKAMSDAVHRCYMAIMNQ